MFYHLNSYGYTSSLSICQYCGIVSLKTTENKIFYTCLIYLDLWGIISKYMIKFIISFFGKDNFLLSIELYASTLIISNLFRDHWTNSNSNSDSSFCAFTILIFLSLNIHSKLVIKYINSILNSNILYITIIVMNNNFFLIL